MRSSQPSLTVPAWYCGAGAASLNRMAAACGLPTTLRAAQVFISLYLRKTRQRNEPRRRCQGSRHAALKSAFGRFKCFSSGLRLQGQNRRAPGGCAMSVKSLLIITAAEAHDVLLAA